MRKLINLRTSILMITITGSLCCHISAQDVNSKFSLIYGAGISGTREFITGNFALAGLPKVDEPLFSANDDPGNYVSSLTPVMLAGYEMRLNESYTMGLSFSADVGFFYDNSYNDICKPLDEYYCNKLDVNYFRANASLYGLYRHYSGSRYEVFSGLKAGIGYYSVTYDGTVNPDPFSSQVHKYIMKVVPSLQLIWIGADYRFTDVVSLRLEVASGRPYMVGLGVRFNPRK